MAACHALWETSYRAPMHFVITCSKDRSSETGDLYSLCYVSAAQVAQEKQMAGH